MSLPDRHTDHALSQEDIDALFNLQSGGSGAPGQRGANAQRYDFRRSDRIPKEQIRALRVVHDTFARGLASSLSAYLRTYINVNLISVEQLSFRDFTGCLPSPTCLTTMRVTPFDGMAMLEINPTLAYPLIEILLGGGKIRPTPVEREMTEIEKQIFEGLLTLILQNLSMAWHSVATVEFKIESHETEPALVQVLPPNEAIVMIATEIQLSETSGMMNIGIPSNIVKLLRQKFEQQWSPRRASVTQEEADRMLGRIGGARLRVEARTPPSMISMSDLLQLSPGHTLILDQRVQEPVILEVNGTPRFKGEVTMSSRRKAVSLTSSL
ncbi:MAG TPA: flagellar motor switch protein FliM [Bryobacteraceae bacterium]|nr:flagellar motor switch protein FliM [Bryobacteraceae bacterium]